MDWRGSFTAGLKAIIEAPEPEYLGGYQSPYWRPVGHVWTTSAGQGILAFSLRSGASHVSGPFARRTWPLALM